MATGWERVGAGGSSSGAVLASPVGVGLGRHVPGPSPALPSNYTNSPASAPTAQPKGPGGRGACGEPRGARRRRLGRQGEETKRGASHLQVHIALCPRLDARRLAPVPNRRGTDRNREGPALQQQRAHFYAHPPALFSWDRGESRSGGQQQRGSAGVSRGRGARATCARPFPRSAI